MSTNTITQPVNHQLQAVIPERYAIGWKAALVCGLFVLMFLYFGYQPVSSPAIWNSVASGTTELQSTQLLPLAEGIRHIDLAPVGNRLIATLYQAGGIDLLSFSFTAIVIASLLFLASTFIHLTGRTSSALACIAIAVLCLPLLNGLTPRILGWFLLCVLAFCLSRQTYRKSDQTVCLKLRKSSIGYRIGIVVLFAVWANIDSSFVIGMVWLGCFAVARFITALQKFGLRRSVADRELQYRIWLLEFAALATLATPNGIGLWKSVFWWPDNPVASSLGGFSPTVLASWSGAAIIIVWAIAFAVSHRRTVHLEWLLPPIVMTIASAFCSSLVFWFVPITAFLVGAVIGKPVNATKKPTRVSESTEQQSGLRFGFTLVAGLLIWVGISMSPWSGYVLGGKTRTEAQLTAGQFPVGVSKHLRNQKADAMLFCPAHWSDWAQVQFGVPVFINADESRQADSVLSDYRLIYRGESNWKHIAQKYALKQMLVDRKKQSRLARRMRQDPGQWRLQYEDDNVLFLTTES